MRYILPFVTLLVCSTGVSDGEHGSAINHVSGLRKVLDVSKSVSPKRVKPATSAWLPATLTIYARCFEGKHKANGKPFRHRDLVLACRNSPSERARWYNRIVTLRRNGHTVTTRVTDTGRLPGKGLIFDGSDAVAVGLGTLGLKRPDRWKCEVMAR